MRQRQDYARRERIGLLVMTVVAVGVGGMLLSLQFPPGSTYDSNLGLQGYAMIMRVPP